MYKSAEQLVMRSILNKSGLVGTIKCKVYVQ